MTDPIATLAGGLIVSCQAYPGEPLRHPETMAQMAEAVVAGGAVAIRAQGLADISFIKGRTTVPLIGLWKDGHDGVFITPTLRHARAVRDAGAEIVALDGTRRPRPDGLTLADTIARLRASGPTLIMADYGSLEDALAASDAGADIIGTTLAGYTGDRPRTTGPDLELLAQMVTHLPGLPSWPRVGCTPPSRPGPRSTPAPTPSSSEQGSPTPPASPAGSGRRSPTSGTRRCTSNFPGRAAGRAGRRPVRYSTASVHQMATVLRTGKRSLFADPKPGPKDPARPPARCAPGC